MSYSSTTLLGTSLPGDAPYMESGRMVRFGSSRFCSVVVSALLKPSRLGLDSDMQNAYHLVWSVYPTAKTFRRSALNRAEPNDSNVLKIYPSKEKIPAAGELPALRGMLADMWRTVL